MKNLKPYLFFNGNCKPAMEFYQKTLGGDLQVFTAGQADQEMFAGADPNLVLNSCLITPSIQFMASDNMKKNTDFGDNICMMLECSSRSELDQLYAALSKGGEADMTPSDQFWGAYFGTLTDPFGVNWMLSFQEECAVK
jgi:PhnB protein